MFSCSSPAGAGGLTICDKAPCQIECFGSSICIGRFEVPIIPVQILYLQAGVYGALAQLVVRYIRIVEARGSTPLCSTQSESLGIQGFRHFLFLPKQEFYEFFIEKLASMRFHIWL